MYSMGLGDQVREIIPLLPLQLKQSSCTTLLQCEHCPTPPAPPSSSCTSPLSLPPAISSPRTGSPTYSSLSPVSSTSSPATSMHRWSCLNCSNVALGHLPSFQTDLEYLRLPWLDVFPAYHYCDNRSRLKAQGDCTPVSRSQLVVVHRNGCGPLPQFCGNPQLQDQVCTEYCQVSIMLSALCSV